ncbi:MAG: FkbM family methyltransferase [Candidatus Niyogibacteria bacterium]|nr:FkbM family methyltransferase [Candidatus Niyogibacteria bacterium]
MARRRALGMYEPEKTRKVKEVLKEGMTFLDAGAHQGYYSLIAAKLGAKTYAIEPEPYNCEILRRNAQANNVGVEILPIALSNKEGEMKLYKGKKSGHFSLTYNRGHGGIMVKVKRLDAVGIKPDAVKIDVEGHEVEVLEGAAEALEGIKHLFLDIHFDVDRKKLFGLLKDFQIYDLKIGKAITHEEAEKSSRGEIYACKQ